MNTALLAIALVSMSTNEFQSTLDRVRLHQQVPGVSAVVTRNEAIVFAGGSGVADLETERTMTADTVVYAGSLSKILTAILTLNLVESGQLHLNDIAEYIATKSPELKDPVNVRHLLTHTSGLEREGNFGYWFSANFPGKTTLRRYLSSTKLRTKPGTEFHYSNVGYATLGLAIEDAIDQPYVEALLRRVLEPLSMPLSGTRTPGATLASGYSPVNRVLPNAENPFAGLGRRVGDRYVREYHNANAMTPAFGAHTSASDLSRVSRFLLGYGGDTVLSSAMRSRMLSEQANGWGLGIRVGKYKDRPVARHGGWFAAHQSHMLLDLRSGISVVVMANSDSASPGKIAEALLDIALQSRQTHTDTGSSENSDQSSAIHIRSAAASTSPSY